MNAQQWKELWDKFDQLADEIDDKFQEEMYKKHGAGHYYLSPEQNWEAQKEIIQTLVEKMLK